MAFTRLTTAAVAIGANGQSYSAPAAGAAAVSPAGAGYVPLFGVFRIVTSATVGNRQMVFEVLDNNSVILQSSLAGALIAASLTVDLFLQQAGFKDAAILNTRLNINIPFNTLILPGWSFRVRDIAAVDNAGDTLASTMVVNQIDGAQLTTLPTVALG